MEQLTVGIYVPSYKRSDAILTYHLFEKCTYMVRKSEAQAYLDAGIAPEDLWAVDDELINNGVKAYFYIVDNAPDDIIVVADDDIEDVIFRLAEPYHLNKDKEKITTEIYRIAQLMYDLDIGFGSNAMLGAPYNYDREFAWKGVPSGIKWFNRKKFKARPDMKVSFNFDIDLVMQELLVNRICLIPKYFCLSAHMDGGKGGNSNKKRQMQINSIENMKLKWGKYFSYSYKSNKPHINVKR